MRSAIPASVGVFSLIIFILWMLAVWIIMSGCRTIERYQYRRDVYGMAGLN